MSFCAKCGAEVSPGSPFCGSCGAPVAGAEAPPAQDAVPVPPPPAAGAPAYGPPAAPPGPGFQPPKSGGGGAKVAVFVLIGILVIGAVVGVILWLTLGGGDDDQAKVEKVVTEFYTAMEKNDAKAMIALLDSASRKELDDAAEDYDYDDGEEFLSEYMDYTFPEGDLKITGLEFETTVNGDKATVEVVGGKAAYTDYYGDEVKENYDDDGEVFSDDAFELKKTDGKWYLQPEFDY